FMRIMHQSIERGWLPRCGSTLLLASGLFAASCGDVTQPSTPDDGVRATSEALIISDGGGDLAASQSLLGGGGLTCAADPVETGAIATIRQGKQTFRYETFGDEAFWGGQLLLHQAIAGAANGGVGSGVSLATALALGLKVDVDALPRDLRRS